MYIQKSINWNDTSTTTNRWKLNNARPSIDTLGQRCPIERQSGYPETYCVSEGSEHLVDHTLYENGLVWEKKINLLRMKCKRFFLVFCVVLLSLGITVTK